MALIENLLTNVAAIAVQAVLAMLVQNHLALKRELFFVVIV